MGAQFPEKMRYVTREWPLAKTYLAGNISPGEGQQSLRCCVYCRNQNLEFYAHKEEVRFLFPTTTFVHKLNKLINLKFYT